MTFTAGAKIRASRLNQLGAIVGRNQRTTNSAGNATITRLLSVRAPVVAGRTYLVELSAEVFGENGATTSQSELRFRTDDVEPLTTSPVLARCVWRHDSTVGIPDSISVRGLFICTATGFLRVAWCLQRVAGTVEVACEADASFPATLIVVDRGTTVATDGTIY